MTAIPLRLSITHQGQYRFLVDFGAELGPLLTDEPDPAAA